MCVVVIASPGLRPYRHIPIHVAHSISAPLVSWRLRLGVVLSVLLHALLLSIPIQGDVFGIAGLRLPWQERRLTASELQVVLAPARTPAAPVAAPAPALVPTPATVPVPVPVPAPPPKAAVVAPAAPRVTVPDMPRQEIAEPALPHIVAEPAPEPVPQEVDRSREVELIALAKAQAEREEAVRVEAERVSAERREGERQAQLEAARQEQEQESRREAARQEAIRQELERQEQASREQEQREQAAREQAAREQAAREQAAREQAAREQAAREQAAREQAAREQAASEQAAREQAAREQAAREQAAREQERASQAQAGQAALPSASVVQGPPTPLAPREERLRAIAEQLAREAAQRNPSNSPPGAPQPTVSGQRRGWLFGRSDPNQDLVVYAQAMSRKIEMNMTLDMVRAAVKQPHTQPVVTVAVRADGSVEKVTFVTSSGVAAIDDGIRQIIASQAPYGPFPPALARQYDVVEIRRTWLFDVAVRLQ